ncbi:MAG TPA: DUF6343 family protein [Pilimelia sp.]|nr:DUF6343 family protein [Pilimelia sp.]
MPVAAQPPGRRGTVGHPYSALNLRLLLAVFGLVVCAAGAALAFRAGLPLSGALLTVAAVVAVVDLTVIQARRRARRRADPDHHSLFE